MGRNFVDRLTAVGIFFIFPVIIFADLSETDRAKEEISKASRLFDSETQSDIQIALNQWDLPQIRDIALTSAIARNELFEQHEDSQVDGIRLDLLTEHAIETQILTARMLYANLVGSLSKTSQDISAHLKTEKKDLLTLADQKISFRLNPLLEHADASVHQSFDKLEKFIRNSSAKDLLRFNTNRSSLLLAYNYFLEAKTSRLETAAQWAQEIESITTEIVNQAGLRTENSRSTAQRWGKILEHETAISVRRAWVNRDTITAVGLAALASAQTICVLVTVGICAASLPATAEWYIVGGRIAMSAARTGVAASSLINIIDRYRFNGASGLATVATAMDTLIIITALPKASIAALESTKTFTLLGRSIKASDLALNWNTTQITAAKSTFAIGVSYGTWQIAKAESIAETLSKESSAEVTATEVRRQGAIYIMMGILGGLEAYRSARFQMENSSTYRNYVANKPSMLESQLSGFKSYSPFQAIGKIINGVKQVPENFWLGTKTTALGLGQLTYQVISAGALALMSYTYPDFLMRRKNKPLPDLREGESALLLNGFASNDMLYYAFASEYANRYEIDKYSGPEKNQLGGEFFESPEAFFKKIEKFAKTHGRIRYLKIMAHGVPGRIVPVATQDVMDGSSRELLDAEYIRAHREEIKKIANESMAPDAQIVIISCLVGGNLSRETSYRGITFEEKSGDHFIQALGDALLPQGGSIDSSRRIIMGLDGTISPTFRHLIYAGINTPQNRYEFENQVSELIKKEKEFQKQMIFDDREAVSYDAIAMGLGKRMVAMYSQIWALAYKFGFNGDGGFFNERHRHDDFPSQKTALAKAPGF